MSKLFAYSHTQAGIARLQRERQPTLATIEPVEVKRALVRLPEPVAINVPQCTFAPNNIVAFRTPKDEFRRIIDLVARMHGSSYRAVMSKTRFKPHPLARQACICAIRQAYPNRSLPEIGRIFGRDHTTVLHAMRVRGA
jgi:hypothetical protein